MDKLIEAKCANFVGSDIHKQGHIKNFSNNVKVKNKEGLEEIIQKNMLFG